MLRGRSDGDHIIQRAHHLQPRNNVDGDVAGYGRDDIGDDDAARARNVPVARRRKGEKLDVRVRVLDRPLLVVVGVASPTSTGAEKISGSPLRHLLHLLLWPHPIPHHRRRLRARRSGLALSLRR